MASPDSIPVAMYGRDPKTAESVRTALLPEYDAVHNTLTLPSALSELPALFGGDVSVANIGKRVPSILVFGGGVPPAEIEEVTAKVLEAKADAKFVRVTREEILAAGGQGPDAAVIGKVLKTKMVDL